MKRTQVVCLLEGKRDSIDLIFANRFLKSYEPGWLHPWKTGIARFVPCGGKTELLTEFPNELINCGRRGADTTLIVMSDLDNDNKNSDELKNKYRQAAKEANISDELFNKVIFIFPKDRLENWVQFLHTGTTDELVEAPRVKNKEAVEAARKLADRCRAGSSEADLPPSLKWSCLNWKALAERMRQS